MFHQQLPTPGGIQPWHHLAKRWQKKRLKEIKEKRRGYRTKSDIAFRDADPDEYAVLAMGKRLYFNSIGVLTSRNPRQVWTRIGKITDWTKCLIIELGSRLYRSTETLSIGGSTTENSACMMSSSLKSTCFLNRWHTRFWCTGTALVLTSARYTLTIE